MLISPSRRVVVKRIQRIERSCDTERSEEAVNAHWRHVQHSVLLGDSVRCRSWEENGAVGVSKEQRLVKAPTEIGVLEENEAQCPVSVSVSRRTKRSPTMACVRDKDYG